MENHNTTLSKFTVLSAVFLVAGTCIGGGMLALPIATGVSGFLPSLAVMGVCWLAMTLTALLLLEVTLWMEDGVHIITMTSRLLGVPGRLVSWCLYLFICYASLVAYTAGGGHQISNAFINYFNLPVSKEIGCVIFILLFGIVVDMGSQVVGRINSILFIAMIVAYFALVGMGVDEVDPQYLTHTHWSLSLLAIPLTLTTFSFQTMVPSLTPYLKRNAKALRIAVVGGTIITFVIYAIWQWLILGIVPVDGPHGLAEALLRGEPPTHFLGTHVEGYWIVGVAEYFAFFAIVTSFLGIGLGLFDFLSDGLKVKKQGWGKLFLGVIIIAPTLFFATKYERAFLVAMETTGGIGDTILNGMIPVLMVWIGRYRMNMTGPIRVWGGKPALVAIFAFFLFAFIIQILAYTIEPASMFNAYDVLKHKSEL